MRPSALLGPSGSGKTTLLHVLGGLVPVSSGEVTSRGKELATLDRAARQREHAISIAFVFQGANLLPSLNARENIAFAILASGRVDEAGPPGGTAAGSPRHRMTF